MRKTAECYDAWVFLLSRAIDQLIDSGETICYQHSRPLNHFIIRI